MICENETATDPLSLVSLRLQSIVWRSCRTAQRSNCPSTSSPRATVLIMLLQLLLLAATSAGATAAVKTVGAAAAPDATSILGVNVHSDTPDLDLIEAAGLRWVRMDMAWQLLEPRVGVYDFAATDPFFKQLAARKMGVISILGDWNPLYSAGPEEVGPHLTNASSIAAFARFGRAVAARYSRDGVLFELINEPNTGGGYKNASLYAEVALAAGGAIRSAGGKVAAPALAGPDAAWLQVTLDAGLLSVVVGPAAAAADALSPAVADPAAADIASRHRTR